MKQIKHRYINARRKTANNESILLTSKNYLADFSKVPLNRNPHHGETTDWHRKSIG